ncbi:MAG: indole-3-glycerol phosphate synthase TrpC, partial [Leptospiraceae bacterium]|nr:indole-3-glycerol phosphate synthase TrpC [Leptospiraceae bacterium]
MLLEKILRKKQEEIQLLKQRYNFERENPIYVRNSPSHRFYSYLKKRKPFVIAEVKKASPSMGVIRQDYQPAKIAKFYESLGATAISVLTDQEFFLGSIEDLQRVRSSVYLPVLRKDFLLSKEQILESKINGADAILLIVRILSKQQLQELFHYATELGLDCLVEV